ncbi:hypothetical protein DL546_002345 [Coniochaeta pulveracea]|uniref:Uncharacterized protein n=1 Tax=Coniochaeta pulveracea TaxID=177199 RepID=A0A420XXS1_9PEZI|nr:hypothetical protein DL546_002345 [Coniochaeta pulveracea]
MPSTDAPQQQQPMELPEVNGTITQQPTAEPKPEATQDVSLRGGFYESCSCCGVGESCACC